MVVDDSTAPVARLGVSAMKCAARPCWLALEIAVLIFLCWFFLISLNIQMDEMQIAYPFGCASSLQAANSQFREPCRIYDLLPPTGWGNWHLPLRVAAYVGSIQGLLYWPFWKFIPSAISVRIFRLTLFWLTAALLAKLCKIPRGPLLFSMVAAMPLCFVAIGFAVSEILFCITLFFVLLHAAHRDTRGSRLLLIGAGLGFCLTLGVMMRLNFLLYAPGLLTGMLLFLVVNRGLSVPISLGMLSVALLTFGVPSAVFLNCRNMNGTRFGDILAQGLPTTNADSSIIAAFRRGREIFSRPLFAASYHRLVNPADGFFELSILAVSFFAVLLLCYWRSKPSLIVREQLPWFAMLALCLACTLASPKVYGWHHLTPALAGLFPALAYAFARLQQDIPGRRRSRLLAGVFLVVMLAAASLFTKTASAREDARYDGTLPAWSDELIQRYGRSHIIVVLDWGPYYFLLGSGEKQLALFWPWTLQPWVGREIRLQSQTLKRPILLIYQRPLPKIKRKKLFHELGPYHIISAPPGFRWAAAEVIPRSSTSAVDASITEKRNDGEQ
jgi:hypothetical protein